MQVVFSDDALFTVAVLPPRGAILILCKLAVGSEGLRSCSISDEVLYLGLYMNAVVVSCPPTHRQLRFFA